MRDPESLPEDPADWPRDPKDLLGVSHSADEPAVRRAYLKLIRRFKPDSAPRQFQLIREAYESLLRGLARPGNQAPAQNFSTGRSDAFSENVSTNQPVAPDTGRPAGPGDSPELIRRMINAGEIQQVRDWAEHRLRGGRSDLGTLLVSYLIRQAAPELAPAGDPPLADEALLGEILKRNSMVGMNLLTERLRSNPAFARSEQFPKYVAGMLDPRVKVALLLLRWGCLEIDDWEMVLAELESQRGSLLDHPEHWANLGCEVLKFACWKKDSEPARNFVDQFTRDLKSVAYELQDRILLAMDQLEDVVEELAGRQHLLQVFDWRLIPHSFTRQPWLLSRELRPLWEVASRSPLWLADALNQEAECFPKSIAALRRLIRQACLALIEPQYSEPAAQAAAVQKFLGQQKRDTYQNLRPAILRFCADYGLDYFRFSRSASGAVDPQATDTDQAPDGEWGQLWRSDPGLDCVSMLLQLPLGQP